MCLWKGLVIEGSSGALIRVHETSVICLKVSGNGSGFYYQDVARFAGSIFSGPARASFDPNQQYTNLKQLQYMISKEEALLVVDRREAVGVASPLFAPPLYSMRDRARLFNSALQARNLASRTRCRALNQSFIRLHENCLSLALRGDDPQAYQTKRKAGKTSLD